MKIVLTARARADLRGIGQWIARDNPARSISFVTELRERALALAENYRLYPALSDADEHRDLRRLDHGDHRIIYQVRPALNRVDILFIHHGRRAQPPLR